MDKIYREYTQVPIPDFAQVKRPDCRVFVISDADGGPRRETIGYVTGEGTMSPNERFRLYYPDLWNEAIPDDRAPSPEVNFGMYAMTLTIATRTGLYRILQDAYGTERANAILDYAMFSVMRGRSDRTPFEEKMADQVRFTDALHTEEWYSNFFEDTINGEMNEQFRCQWIRKLQETHGTRKVWLCLDSFYRECQRAGLYDNEQASHLSEETRGRYIHVVDAQSGRPVTWYVCERGVPVGRHCACLAKYLEGLGLEIEGVMSVGDDLDGWPGPYITLIPSNAPDHAALVRSWGDDIRWNPEYLVYEDGSFGRAIDEGHDDGKAGAMRILFFDAALESQKSIRLNREIIDEQRRLSEAIQQGREAVVQEKYRQIVSVEGSGRTGQVTINYDAWQQLLYSQGFFTMRTSPDMNAEKAYDAYEKSRAGAWQYGVLMQKAELARTENGTRATMALAAGLIDLEIGEVRKALDMDSADLELDEIGLLYLLSRRYRYISSMTEAQKHLLKAFGLTEGDMASFAQDYNARMFGAKTDQERTLKEHPEPAQQVRPRRGRPPKPKKTITETEDAPAPKAKVGRPKGRKDTTPRKPRSDKGKPRGKRQTKETGVIPPDSV
ncbi:MAG: hypothetical protein IJ083_08270 [Clostridia bacterium]|nr:hypothetical protein [Clostridia bacterium]